MSPAKSHHPHQNPCYLLFWPVFGLRYLLLENFHPASNHHPVHCFLDDKIPFLELFLVPYLLWHLCIIGVHVWLYVRNDPAYRQYSRFLMVSMSISTAVFLMYPTCQNLRPTVFPRDNALTRAVQFLYRMDTNTNVCPSEHVIGAAGFFLAVRYSCERTPAKRRFAAVVAALAGISTVFLKQHSFVDVLTAIPVCIAGWSLSFRRESTEGAFRTARHHFFGRSSA